MMQFDFTINFVDVLIAIIGLVISVVQMVDFYRKNREESKVQETVTAIGQMSTEIRKLRDEHVDVDKMMVPHRDALQRILSEYRSELVTTLKAAIENGESPEKQSEIEFDIISRFYNNFLSVLLKEINSVKEENSKLEEMYRILLQREKYFSISYGFNRYIDVLRNYLNQSVIEEFTRITNNIEEDVNYFNTLYDANKEKGLYPVQYKYIVYLLWNNGKTNILDGFQAEDIVQDTMFKMFATDRAKDYMKLLDESFCVSLANAYQAIDPYLKEMEIKFKNEEKDKKKK